MDLKSLALLLLVTTSASAAPFYNENYGPYPPDTYPQVIQSDDYPTIQFIETLYSKLAAAAPAQNPAQFARTIDCDFTPGALRFHSKTTPSKSFLLQQPQNQPLRVDNAAKPTARYRTTLFQLLSTLTAQFGNPTQVRFAQFHSRIYKTRTFIEFDFGPKILAIESDANGPDSPQRCYILDVIDRKDSMLME
jgi:hypothetical protein